MWIIWSQIGFNSIFSQFSPCVIVYQYLVRVTHFLGDFGQKEVFLWSKTVLFGQEVHTISPCVVVYWYLVPKSLNCKLHFIILYFVHCWSIFGLKIFGRNMFGRVEVSYLKANSHSIFIFFFAVNIIIICFFLSLQCELHFDFFLSIAGGYLVERYFAESKWVFWR